MKWLAIVLFFVFLGTCFWVVDRSVLLPAGAIQTQNNVPESSYRIQAILSSEAPKKGSSKR